MPSGPIGADATIAVVVPAPQARDSRVSDPFFLELLAGIAEAARERNTAVILAIDEFQYVKESEMAALISSLHAVAQAQLPVAMVAAGLPQLLGQMGRAKSYAERLFAA